MSDDFRCGHCNSRPGVKTDSEGVPCCLQCLGLAHDPYRRPVGGRGVGRNDPCACGSGRKRKKCCG